MSTQLVSFFIVLFPFFWSDNVNPFWPWLSSYGLCWVIFWPLLPRSNLWLLLRGLCLVMVVLFLCLLISWHCYHYGSFWLQISNPVAGSYWFCSSLIAKYSCHSRAYVLCRLAVKILLGICFPHLLVVVVDLRRLRCDSNFRLGHEGYWRRRICWLNHSFWRICLNLWLVEHILFVEYSVTELIVDD
jgi:hypothetical protein